MAISLSKATDDLVSMLKKLKFADNKKKTYWNVLSEQMEDDGSWDDDLLDKVKEEIISWMSKLKKEDLQTLWNESEIAAESYVDEEMPDEDVVFDELGEEMLDLVLDKFEDLNPQEEFFIPEDGNKKKFKDDFDDDFDDDIFDDDDEEFDDFGDEDFFDDDKY